MPHKDPAAHRAYQAAWRAANKENIRAWSKKYFSSAQGKERNRAAKYKRYYGITIADYDAMLAAQGGRCALCRTDKSMGRGRFHVDHDHATGRVRGILCHVCNTSLGRIEKFDWMTYLRGPAT